MKKIVNWNKQQNYKEKEFKVLNKWRKNKDKNYKKCKR